MFPTQLPNRFKAANDHDQRPPSPVASPPIDTSSTERTSNSTDLATSLYETTAGLISLTWSRSFLGHSLHFQLHTTADNFSPSRQTPASASFHLHLKHFNFWKKSGSKKLPIVTQELHPIGSYLRLYWDFSKAVFAPSDPGPVSGYYIAAVVDRELVMLEGDFTKQAISKIKPVKKPYQTDQLLVLRREHMFGNRVYKTRTNINGRNKEIRIDCSWNNDARFKVYVGREKVLVVKRLKWKFRGNEKVVVDGVPVNISWDVHDWFFHESGDGCAVFMFKFESFCLLERAADAEDDEADEDEKGLCTGKEVDGDSRRGKNMERSSSLSSISMSSGSSGCGTSVMEWSSAEECELLNPVGFTLMIHAWRK